MAVCAFGVHLQITPRSNKRTSCRVSVSEGKKGRPAAKKQGLDFFFRTCVRQSPRQMLGVCAGRLINVSARLPPFLRVCLGVRACVRARRTPGECCFPHLR